MRSSVKASVLKPKGLRLLGNPFTIGTYAKNVWDMQVYNGCIYLGSGNSSNVAPDANAGPIPIIRYNPASNIFEQEYTVNEEQIDIYKILNGRLYVPGHDPKDDQTYGNFYYFNGTNWVKNRTIPNGIHMFDMAYYNSRVYCAMAATSGPFTVSSLESNLNTWTVHDGGADTWALYRPRCYHIVELNNKLYTGSSFSTTDATSLDFQAIEAGQADSVVTFTFANMFPGVAAGTEVKIVRDILANNTSLYICGQVYNDQQFVPLGLYKCTTIGTSTKITLPNASALPVDILVRGNMIYVLSYVKNGDYDYTVIVYRSSDIDTWTEVLRFGYETFMRSFEEIDGDFYFGTGCYTDIIPASIGNILMIRNGGY